MFEDSKSALKDSRDGKRTREEKVLSMYSVLRVGAPRRTFELGLPYTLWLT